MPTSMPLITLELPFYSIWVSFLLIFNEEGFGIFFIMFHNNQWCDFEGFVSLSVPLFICIFSFLFEQMNRASFGPVTLRGHALFLCCFFLLVYWYGGLKELRRGTDQRLLRNPPVEILSSLSFRLSSMRQNQGHIWSYAPGLRKDKHESPLNTNPYKGATWTLGITTWFPMKETRGDQMKKYMRK